VIPTTHIGFFSRRAWDRLHPVGRPFGFRWVQTWRGQRYRVLSLVSEINPITGAVMISLPPRAHR